VAVQLDPWKKPMRQRGFLNASARMLFVIYTPLEVHLMISLLDLVSQYVTIRKLAPGSVYLLRRTATVYGEHLGRAATIVDLTDLAVSGWLAALESTAAPWTRTGHRTRILGLWRFAARRKLCEPPGEVRREPAPEPMPEAWTAEEVRRLVAACDWLNDRARAYFRALILAAYESGLRRGDLRSLDRNQIKADGVIAVRMHKTSVPHVVCVRPETAVEILSLPGQKPLACPWSSGRYGEYWFRLCCNAGVRHGGCQQLRRTGATLVAAEHGEDAARSWLGHRSPEMLSHYLDRRVTQPRPFLPPRAG
jgi:integrase